MEKKKALKKLGGFLSHRLHVVMLLALLTPLAVFGAYIITVTISNLAEIASTDIQVTDAFNNPISSINWGTLDPNATYTKNLRVWNTGERNVTVTVNLPTIANTTLSINPNTPQFLQPANFVQYDITWTIHLNRTGGTVNWDLDVQAERT